MHRTNSLKRRGSQREKPQEKGTFEIIDDGKDSLNDFSDDSDDQANNSNNGASDASSNQSSNFISAFDRGSDAG